MDTFDSPDRPAFARAILERPDDAAPKLIYADWLDEQGHPADTRIAGALRWMAAFGRWPSLVQDNRGWYGGGRRDAWTARWRGGRPIAYDGFPASAYLPPTAAKQLRADPAHDPIVGYPVAVRRWRREEYHLGWFDYEADAIGTAIEHLANALTETHLRLATRRLRAVAA